MDWDEPPEASHMTVTRSTPENSSHFRIWFDLNETSSPRFSPYSIMRYI